MNCRRGWCVALGAVLWLCPVPAASAGWITLTSGRVGGTQPADGSTTWFGTDATPRLAIDGLSGVGTVRATTAGGSAYFSGLGVPVLLDLSDGTATVAGGSPPAGAAARGADGTPLGAGATAAPRTGAPVTADYARLGLTAGTGANGQWVLTASVLGADAGLLGSSSVVVPEGGWWLLGLGSDTPAGAIPDPVPGPGTPATGPAPGVPEPGTAALVAGGVLAALPWLRRGGRRKAC